MANTEQMLHESPEETARQVNKFKGFEGNPDFVLSLARGLRAIEAFDGHTDGLSVVDLAREAGLSRAAARRFLLTLELLGYAENYGRAYRLKSRVMRLGFSYLSSSSLPNLAQPILEDVTRLVHESSSLTVLDGDEIVYVARSAAKRVMSVGLSVGSRLPAFCTSMGRVLLSAFSDEELTRYLSRVELKAFTPKTIVDRSLLRDIIARTRLEGFALVDEELELGLRSIAVPVRTRRGRIAAAINIGLHAARVSISEMTHRLLPILREHSEMIGQRLE